MRTLLAPFTDDQCSDIRQQLDRVLEDSLFRNSTRYPLFLRFVVEKTLAQETTDLKERVIGVDVFGQPCDYDTNTTPIVRFCASETRKRLALYYQSSEHQNELRIVMQPGKYVPGFCIPAQLPQDEDDRKQVMLPSGPVLNGLERRTANVRIVVLPFDNLNADEKNDFANGITEQIICRCGVLLDSIVIVAPPSTLHANLGSKSALQLCHELKADYFLAGSTLQTNTHVRVNVRLAGPDGACIWTNSYVGTELQTLAEQDHIACSIVQQLTRIFSPPIGLETTFPAAQHALGLAMHLLERRTESSVLRGIEQFRKSIALDDRLPLAQCGLAFALLTHAWLGGNFEGATLYSHTIDAAKRAIDTAPQSSLPYLVLATLQHGYDLNEPAAEENCRRALLADPCSVHANLLLAFLNTTSERYDEAMNFAMRARKIEPFSGYVQGFVAFNLYCSGKFEEAIRAAEMALQFDNDVPTALAVMGMALEATGQTAEAVEQYQRGLRSNPTSRLFLSHLGYAFALLSRKKNAAEIILHQLIKEYKPGRNSSYSIASIYAALGRHDDSLEWLERAFADRSFSRVMCRVDPRLQVLSSSSRFKNLTAVA